MRFGEKFSLCGEDYAENSMISKFWILKDDLNTRILFKTIIYTWWDLPMKLSKFSDLYSSNRFATLFRIRKSNIRINPNVTNKSTANKMIKNLIAAFSY